MLEPKIKTTMHCVQRKMSYPIDIKFITVYERCD